MNNYCLKQHNSISFPEKFFRKRKKKIEKEEFEGKDFGTIYHYTFKAIMYNMQKLSTKSTILGLDTPSLKLRRTRNVKGNEREAR